MYWTFFVFVCVFKLNSCFFVVVFLSVSVISNLSVCFPIDIIYGFPPVSLGPLWCSLFRKATIPNKAHLPLRRWPSRLQLA